MPGKRSYVSALPGCLTKDQLRRQARDHAFLPQPPPPPLLEVPHRRTAWADFPDGERDDSSNFAVTTCEQETQCDPFALSFGQANPPSSGQFLDTINQALKIIELQCQRPDLSFPIRNSVTPRTISLDSLVPSPSCVAPPLGDAIMCNEPCAEWHTLVARPSETRCFGDDEMPRHNDSINALPEHFNIAADDNVGPFTPAQNIVLDREINATVMKVLDPLMDMIIAKVVVLIENNVKTAIEPVCHDLSCRLDALQGEQTAIAADIRSQIKDICFSINLFLHRFE